MAHNWRFREATSADLPQIAALEREWVRDVPTWGYRPRTDAELRAVVSSPTWVVVAVENESIVGFAIGAPRENDGSAIFEPSDRILEVVDLYVTRNSRSQGVGTQLLQAAEEYARRSGFTKLFVYSSVRSLDGPLNFYRSRGFTPWAVQLFKELDVGA